MTTLVAKCDVIRIFDQLYSILVVQQLADFREIRELGSTYKSSKT